MLERYEWPEGPPGLVAVIERAVATSLLERIEPQHLPVDVRARLPDVVRRFVRSVLANRRDNALRAAEILGLRRRTFVALLDELNPGRGPF
jgi:DNA-binding NtrC family response regulator